MKKEFEITEDEMDKIIAINKAGEGSRMSLRRSTPIDIGVQEKVDAYWQLLSIKYGFNPLSTERSLRGPLFFFAEPSRPMAIPITETTMKKVMYRKWIDSKIDSETEKREPGTGRWQEDFVNHGLFHQWGLDVDRNGSFSVALVQDYTGEIEMVLPRNIKFND